MSIEGEKIYANFYRRKQKNIKKSTTEKLKDNPDANYAEMGCYLPLGTLMVKFDGMKESEAKHYSRVLNIRNGTHTVEFEANGGKQTRTAFASVAGQVLVYHVSSETPVSGRVEYRDAREGITVIEGIIYDAPPEWGDIAFNYIKTL